AARSVSVSAILLLRCFFRPASGQATLGLDVGNRCLDRVLGQYRAVDLHRRQAEFLGDFGVADGGRVIERATLDPLGQQRAGGNGGTTAISLELRVFDHASVVDLDLQAHDVT